MDHRGFDISLCSRDDIGAKMRKKIENIPAVHIGNPKTLEFQVARTALLPGLLKTAQATGICLCPWKFLKSQMLILKDWYWSRCSKWETSVGFYDTFLTGFEIIHGLGQSLQLLEVPRSENKSSAGYYLNSSDDETSWQGCANCCLWTGDWTFWSAASKRLSLVSELNHLCSAIENHCLYPI